MKSVFTGLLLAVAVATVGCGKDQTAEEYQREKLQKNLSVYESVAGRYTGTVYSAKTGKAMGALELNLSAETSTSNTSGADSALGTPVLVTNVRFMDKALISLTVPSSYYDQDSKNYSADIVIEKTDSGGSEDVTIRVSGALNGATITGSIRASNEREAAGTFVLSRNGKPISEVAKDGPGGGVDRTGVSRTYEGKGSIRQKKKTPMRLQVSRPSVNPLGQFVDIFYPSNEKRVNVSVMIAEDVWTTITDVRWDAVNGILDGSQNNSTVSGTYTSNIQCSNFYFTAQAEPFACLYWTSRSPEIPMEFEP